MSLVQIAVPVPLFKNFTYSVPENLRPTAQVGVRVLVPFGRRTMTGVIVEHLEQTDLAKVRPIHDVLDALPIFTPEMLRFANWMSEYYMAPLGETLRSMLPQGMSPESSQRVMIGVSDVGSIIGQLRRTAPRQAAILTALSDHPRGVTINYLQKKVGAENLYSQLSALEAKGLILRQTEDARGARAKTARGVRIAPELLADEARMHELLDALDAGAPKQAAIMSLLYTQAERNDNAFVFATEVLQAAGASDSALKGLKDRGAVEIEQVEVSREELLAASDGDDDASSIIEPGQREIIPNRDQAVAITEITSALDEGAFRTFMLHGVTGSGKTQVYIESIKHVLASGRRAIMLVPEIALTLQLVERFVSVFGDRVAVLHSRLSEGERFDAWRRAAAGGCDVVVGARSALFAPLRNVGIVVVDEEHDGSYKQYDAQPRYNARDGAIMRAHIEGAVAVLGSATPSVESYYNAEQGKYRLLRLDKRVDDAQEPKMVVVDTGTARKQKLMRGSLSVRLISDIKLKLARGEGVILFQNRRGFATRLECTSCSHSPMCPHCAVTLTFHKNLNELRCHYCGFARKAELQCEVCGNFDLRQPGVGTQKVEEELSEQLPDAKIQRMDLDTTSRKGSHRRILAAFARGDIDVLLGTQMVAKGLDFSRVTLVGVISADTQLLLPDFRASERTYQLLTQVSGRAGRRGNMQGEVVIQTSHPLHPAVQAAFAKNYNQMYRDELQTRQELNYPPFSRFIVIEFRSEEQKEADEHSQVFRKMLPADDPAFDVLGPTPALIWKLRNYYRYQIVIKNRKSVDPSGRLFTRTFTRVYERHRSEHGKSSVQTYVGDQTGERVSIWTDYGMTYRKVENHRPSVEGAPGPRENTITITTPEKFYMLDVDTKTGNWDVNDGDEQYLKDDSLSKIPFGVMMEDISAAGVLTHVTDTTVNGYNLKVQDLNGPGYRVRLWKWRGVTLMEQFVEVGSPDPDMFWIVPSAINFSPQITEATFAEPEGYKLEKGPPRRSPFPGPGEGGPTPPGAPAPGTPGGPAPMPPPQGGR